MYILGINGSHDHKGDIQFLLKSVLGQCAQNGYETEIVNATDAVNSAKFPWCVSCSSPCNKSCYQGTLLEDVFAKMRRADAIVIGSPVYFGSMTGQLKCLFDKTRDLRAEKALVGKIGAAVTCGGSKYGGQETTMRAIHDVMFVEGMTIVGGGAAAFDAGHHGIAARHPAAGDDNAIERCKILAARLMEQLGR